MKCIRCRKEIPEQSLYCLYCGKKQSAQKKKTNRRPNGTGTVSRDSRCKNIWIAHAPSSGGKRVYLGSFPTAGDARNAIDNYLREGCPEMYHATLEEIYQLWSEIHYRQVSDSAVRLYSSTWKRFAEIRHMKMHDIRTVHFQKIVNQAKSESACHAVRTLAVLICRYALENDVIQKNYAEFIQIPRFEKSEKKIFTPEEIALLWAHSDDKRVQLILFLIYTGLRIGEASNLKVSDMDFVHGYFICGEKTKAGRNRIVPFPENVPEIAEFVKSWIQDDSQKTVLNATTAQLRHQYFYSALADLHLAEPDRIEHGIYQFSGAHLTPHSTRHTFASLSASAGIAPEHLRKIIGHANYSTTAEIYIHQNLEELKSEMKKITKA